MEHKENYDDRAGVGTWVMAAKDYVNEKCRNFRENFARLKLTVINNGGCNASKDFHDRLFVEGLNRFRLAFAHPELAYE